MAEFTADRKITLNTIINIFLTNALKGRRKIVKFPSVSLYDRPKSLHSHILKLH
jgi:hypothetical protein